MENYTSNMVGEGLPPVCRLTSFVLVIAFHAFALAEDRKTTTASTLDGTWRADVSQSQSINLSIKDSRIEMTAFAGEKQLPRWVGKLSISQDEPDQHMDWVELRSGNTKLPDNKCLFQLHGDVLLVIGGGPNQRPTRFFSGAGDDPKTLIFIRVTAKKKVAEQNAEPEVLTTGF